MPITPDGSGEVPGGSQGVAGGQSPDELEKLLAFRYGVPPVEGEPGWAGLSPKARAYWRDEAEMVRGYLEHGVGWTKPQARPVDTGWEDRKRRGFDCPMCLGTGRTVHSDMPDGSSRAQTCLTCGGSGRTEADAVTADQEGPELGHTFRLEAHSRGSYGLLEEGDPAPHDYEDADWFGEPPLTLEVRAWNLRDALLKAARIGLPEWRREGRRLADG
jgi:hypothetical protein